MTLTPIDALNRVVDARFGVAKLKGFRSLANLAEMDRIRVRGNTDIRWNVDQGGAVASFEAITANGANTATDVTLPASLPSGTHRLKHQFDLSKLDVQNAANLGNDDLVALFTEYSDRAIEAIMRRLNTAIYQGDGSAGWGGIQGLSIINAVAGAYAGITVAQAPLWAPLVNDNGGTNRALTADLVRDIRRQASTNESMFDFVSCHPDMAATYEKVFETIVGAGSFAGVSRTDTALRTSDLGHGGRALSGVPIIEDPAALNNRIYLFDSSEFEIICLALMNSPAEGIGRHVVNRSYGIPVHIQEIASDNTSVRRFEFSVYAQIKMRTRKASMEIRDLTSSF